VAADAKVVAAATAARAETGASVAIVAVIADDPIVAGWIPRLRSTLKS
jgi:hypothetical protein